MSTPTIVGEVSLVQKGGMASLNGVVWRVNPEDIAWNFTIDTSVQVTVGGRVVQVLGATLDDLVITGRFGQDVPNSAKDGPGMGWRLSRDFMTKVHDLISYQSRDATTFGQSGPPLLFQYPARGWAFDCYIKGYADPSGGSLDVSAGRFDFKYQLRLKIIQDRSDKVAVAGESNGVVDTKKQQAIEAYITRVSDGIGWKKTALNDPQLQLDIWGRDVSSDSYSGFDDPSDAVAKAVRFV